MFEVTGLTIWTEDFMKQVEKELPGWRKLNEKRREGIFNKETQQYEVMREVPIVMDLGAGGLPAGEAGAAGRGPTGGEQEVFDMTHLGGSALGWDATSGMLETPFGATPDGGETPYGGSLGESVGLGQSGGSGGSGGEGGDQAVDDFSQTATGLVMQELLDDDDIDHGLEETPVGGFDADVLANAHELMKFKGVAKQARQRDEGGASSSVFHTTPGLESAARAAPKAVDPALAEYGRRESEQQKRAAVERGFRVRKGLDRGGKASTALAIPPKMVAIKRVLKKPSAPPSILTRPHEDRQRYTLDPTECPRDLDRKKGMHVTGKQEREGTWLMHDRLPSFMELGLVKLLESPDVSGKLQRLNLFLRTYWPYIPTGVTEAERMEALKIMLDHVDFMELTGVTGGYEERENKHQPIAERIDDKRALMKWIVPSPILVGEQLAKFVRHQPWWHGRNAFPECQGEYSNRFRVEPRLVGKIPGDTVESWYGFKVPRDSMSSVKATEYGDVSHGEEDYSAPYTITPHFPPDVKLDPDREICPFSPEERSLSPSEIYVHALTMMFGHLDGYRVVVNDLRMMIRTPAAIRAYDDIRDDPKVKYLEENYVEKMVNLYWAEPRINEILTSIFRRMLFVYTHPEKGFEGPEYMHKDWFSAFVKYDVLMKSAEDESAGGDEWENWNKKEVGSHAGRLCTSCVVVVEKRNMIRGRSIAVRYGSAPAPPPHDFIRRGTTISG